MKNKKVFTLTVTDATTGEPIECYNGLITSEYYNEKECIKAGKIYERMNEGEIVHINYGEYKTPSGNIWGDIYLTIPISEHPAY